MSGGPVINAARERALEALADQEQARNEMALAK